MNAIKNKFYFLKNNLFTSYMLEVGFPKHYAFKANANETQKAFDDIKALYNKDKFTKQNEHQFEDNFIAKVAQILGYHFVRQEEKIIQGKLEKPDFLLFTSKKDKESYEQIPKNQRGASNEYIAVILESKAYNVEVDNKKVKDNPHFQILRYLSNLKLDFGFLTNGKFWRFYDNSKLSATKVFYEINLEEILHNDDLEAFCYFYYFFHSKNFTQQTTESKPINKTLTLNDDAKITIEDDLEALIYGTNGQDSLFELIGTAIFIKNQNATLTEIYENSLYFIFRLLFIAYFEDKFSDILSKHEYFASEISLVNLHTTLESKKGSFKGFVKLNTIFKMYDKGEPNYNMPVFNGGLFDSTKTPLLSTPQLFDDVTLKEILKKFFYFDDGQSLFKRDYKTLSVAHLGTIYEGLLGYFFALADEDLLYVKYHTKGNTQKEIENYIDRYDYAELEKQEKLKKLEIISSPKLYKKGQIYLKNTSNSRKSTASFYTPQSITNFLVTQGLKERLNNENILRFKILDNACGSGHFLIEALNQITQIVLENFDDFANLKQIYEAEKKEIQNSTTQYLRDHQIDESDIVKRLLLKRVIFGVDSNPFSVELTKLSLWIDSFIFGTPLSFIEHHIKCGNALIGASLSEFANFYKSNKKDASLFTSDLMQEFKTLSEVFDELDSLHDTTAEQIAYSKQIYQTQILPKLTKLNLYLNYYTALNLAQHSQQKELKKVIELEKFADSNEEDYKNARQITQNLSREFAFFNYEVEFPEIIKKDEFGNIKFIGFDMIVGNPPWDKTKFSDNDFFPQFKSDYRTLSNTKKAEFKANQLAKDYIKKAYDAQKTATLQQNNYYKAHFPLNLGDGDGNLFRFFVERNLRLLASKATLNYILPSALMLENGSYNLRKEILQNRTINLFYSFENRDGIFNEVHRSYKFALMQIYNDTPPKNHAIKTMFYKTKIDEIYDENNVIKLNLDDIKMLSPTYLALQEVQSKKDLNILEKCYTKFAPLKSSWLDFRRELDMTNDKDLFIETHKEELLPLYEGKMIYQNNAEFSTPNYFLDKNAFDLRLKSKEIYRLKQDLKIDNKKYTKLLENLKPTNMSVQGFEKTLIKYDREFFRLGFRAIASDTNERTLIFSLLPKDCGVGNSVWSSITKSYLLNSAQIHIKTISTTRLCFALGIFNSLVVDFLARTMIQINVNKTYLERIPLPQPNDDEIMCNKAYTSIARNALILQLYNDKAGYFDKLKIEFKIKQSEIPTTSKLYDTLKARLDIAVAQLYGLNFDDFCHILKSFKVLNKNQPKFIILLKSLWKNNKERK